MAKVFRRSLVVALGLVFFLALSPVRIAQYIYGRIVAKGLTLSIDISEVFAETFYTVEEALKVLLPQAQDIKEEVKTLSEEQKKAIAKAAGVEFDPEFDKEFHFYISKTGAAVLDIVHGKWGPIKFMLAFDTTGKIKDSVVLELKERRGRPVKERKFLDQYIGKSIADPIKLNKDIKGIAGATISSRQMTTGIKKLVYIYEELYRK